jgi:hypothetical protein
MGLKQPYAATNLGYSASLEVSSNDRRGPL